MEYREIEAANIDEAKFKIKKDYGDRARIIKVVESASGGFLGLGKKKMVKVLISISDVDLLNKYKENMGILTNIKSQNKIDKFESNEKKHSVKNYKGMTDNDTVLQEVMDKLCRIESEIQRKKEGNEELLPANLAEIKQILKENEFFDDFINTVLDKIKELLPYSKIDNRLEVHKFVYDYIRNKLPIYNNYQYIKGEKRILILVGPTGVGKTTTIAKIAANAIREKLKVELITIDGYRIGAKYQLEKYAEYMKTPMSGVEDNLELQKIIDLSDADLILIDTIGRSQKDEMNLVKMKQLLKLNRHQPEFILTVCAATKSAEVKRIFKSFDIFDYNSIIITKVDESETIGAILNTSIEKNREIRYLTDGQRVPNDIEKAGFINLMEKIKGLEMEVYLDSTI